MERISGHTQAVNLLTTDRVPPNHRMKRISNCGQHNQEEGEYNELVSLTNRNRKARYNDNTSGMCLKIHLDIVEYSSWPNCRTCVRIEGSRYHSETLTGGTNYGVPFALLFLRRNFKYLTVILQRTYHNLTVMLLDSDKSLAASLALASESDSHGLQHCPLVVPPHTRVV